MSAAAASAVKGFTFEADDHQAISRLAYEETGIVLPPSKAQLVYGRLVRRVRACGLESFADYIALIEDDPAERARAIDALTTNHTSFFREGHHFEHFTAEVWPKLNATLASGGRVRFWSAACSSGEEPYTLAMAMAGTDAGAAQKLARQDLRILATDLSAEILAAARAGRYAEETVRSIPVALRQRWLKSVGEGAEIKPELRSLIDFRQLNLLKSWPMRQPFDVIFCRNVMIYFDEPTKERLQTRLADQLKPGGTMYIGHSERLAASVAARFTCLGRTIFRKNAA